MKVNVDIRQRSPKEDYNNIFGTDALEGNNVYDAECFEVLVSHQLELLPFDQYEKFLRLWASKLRKGGKLVIVSQNNKKTVRDYLNGQIDEQEFNSRMFSGNLSMPTLSTVEGLIAKIGLVLEKKSIDENTFVVIGKR